MVKAWLCGRRQWVEVEGCRSELYEALSGTCQGGTCSPSYYASVVRGAGDLPLSQGSSLAHFADDAALVRPIRSDEDIRLLQKDVDLYIGYLRNYGLSVNPTKSKILQVSFATTEPLGLRINGALVEEVTSLRYLGVDLDNRLSFKSHWSRITNSAKATIGAIWRLIEGNPVAMKFLVKERVLPLLSYSLLPAPPTTSATWSKVERLLRYAARLITNRHPKGRPALEDVEEQLSHEELLRLAGLPSAKELALTGHLKFMRACTLSGRRWGHFLEFGSHPRLEPPQRAGLRRRHDPVAPSSTPLLIEPLSAGRFESLSLRAPALLVQTWNAFVLELGEEAAAIIGHYEMFSYVVDVFSSERQSRSSQLVGYE